MRDVAVTEGDKVEAQLKFGVSVNTYGVNDLVAVVDQVPDHDIDKLVARWIALAASELVLSSWVELETDPAPQVQPEGPAVPAPVRRAAQAAVRRLTPPRSGPREAGSRRRRGQRHHQRRDRNESKGRDAVLRPGYRGSGARALVSSRRAGVGAQLLQRQGHALGRGHARQ